MLKRHLPIYRNSTGLRAQDAGFSAWEMLVSVDYRATCCLTSWPSFHTKAGKHLPLLADLLV